ncbi:hypothetical protein ACIQNU_15920 [Streptomyces sp. NPDC091292]|uniref:hypothetical protein n=1 Tax=Streptomyces sp. NPDC091292 TaxID=3365991 RepID=UPI0037FFD578
MTRDGLTAAPASHPGALCCRCRKRTYAPVAVRYVERTSGSGVTLYACPSHAVALGAGPTPEDQLRAP